jgi:hypothetical protein
MPSSPATGRPFDLISPQRRPAMQALVESEGFGWLLPGFDRYAQTASQAPHWRLFHLAGSHLPYITSPYELAPMLLELAAG